MYIHTPLQNQSMHTFYDLTEGLMILRKLRQLSWGWVGFHPLDHGCNGDEPQWSRRDWIYFVGFVHFFARYKKGKVEESVS